MPEHERRAPAYLAERFPALAGAPLVGQRACQYELTADTHFVIAPIRTTTAPMGSWAAARATASSTGRRWPSSWRAGSRRRGPEPRFALSPRSAEAGLRTAGIRARV